MSKFVDVCKDWVFPIITLIFTILIAPLLYEYYVTIRPDIKHINQEISDIKSEIITIEARYTKKDHNGVDCTVGVSSETEGYIVTIYENHRFGFKGAETIFLTNPYGISSPTIRCTVRVLEHDGKDTKADFFLSKEALDRLEIDRKKLYQGLFKMKYQMKND